MTTVQPTITAPANTVRLALAVASAVIGLAIVAILSLSTSGTHTHPATTHTPAPAAVVPHPSSGFCTAAQMATAAQCVPINHDHEGRVVTVVGCDMSGCYAVDPNTGQQYEQLSR